jgi:peptidoglycan/LPS O-acetylase OafA/YrhL
MPSLVANNFPEPSSLVPVVSRKSHLDFLDGVRGMAALCVLFDHSIGHVAAHIDAASGTLARAVGLSISVLGAGHYAVDLFIVLSGFCLGLPVARTGLKLPRGALDFYWRRARRILPPYYACTAIMVAYYVLVQRFGNHTQAAPTPLQVLGNVVLLTDVFPKLNAVNGVFWSVAVEWKIYFLLPLFLLVWRRVGWPAMLAAAAGIGLGAIPVIRWINPANNLARCCPWYVMLFALGLLASGALFHRDDADLLTTPAGRRRALALLWPAAFVAALGVTAMLLRWPPNYADDHDPAVSLTAIINDTFAGALAASLLSILAVSIAGGSQNVFVRFAQWSPFVSVGRMGYSVYLMHPLAISICWAIANRLLPDTLVGRLCEWVMCLAATAIVSYPFYWLVEHRFLSRSAARATPGSAAQPTPGESTPAT